MNAHRRVRPATEDDAAACTAIYAPYVIGTPITFEIEPPTPDDMAARIRAATERYAWLVLVDENEAVLGYAYASEFAPRAAYRWACETSVYLDQKHRGAGGGRMLYAALIKRIGQRGYRRLVAIVCLPNAASMGLHRAFGFSEAGIVPKIGWKNGAWHDVAYLELSLTPDEDTSLAPVEPR